MRNLLEAYKVSIRASLSGQFQQPENSKLLNLILIEQKHSYFSSCQIDKIVYQLECIRLMFLLKEQ